MVAIRIPGPEAIDKVQVGGRETTIIPHATAASFGATEAEARGRQAQALGGLGDTILKLSDHFQRQRQDLEDQTYSSTYQTKYEPRVRGEYLAAQQEYPDGGEGFTKSLDERMQKAQKETHEELQAQGLKATAATIGKTDAHAANVRTHYLVNGMSWENNQKVKSLEGQLDENAKTAASGVLATGDIDGGLASVDQAVAAQRGAIPPDKLRIKHQNYSNEVVEAAIQNALRQKDEFGQPAPDTVKAQAIRDQYYGRVGPASAAPEGTPAPAAGGDAYTRRLFKLESGNAYLTGQPAARTGSNYGLGQFSPDLERRYGITPETRNDPAVQARAVEQERAEHQGPLTAALGHTPSDAEFYLAHQQGLTGATKLLTNPDKPAWELIRPYYKSDAMAKLAITGNIPNGIPLKMQPVETISAGQFTQMWDARWNGAPIMPDAGQAIKWDNAIRSVGSNDRKRTQETINNDLASIQGSGKGNPTLTYEAIARSLGRQAADDWQTDRGYSQKFFDHTQDFYALPANEINARLDGLKPADGSPDYIQQDKLHGEAIKKAQRVLKLRGEDPALSISEDPEVQKAAAARDWTKPETVNDLSNARMSAQARAGVAEPSPITRQEGVALVADLVRTPAGQERQSLEKTVQRFQALFGNVSDNGVPRAITALTFALDSANANAEIGKDMTHVVRKLALGQIPTRGELTAADQANQVAAAKKAVSAPLYAEPGYAEEFMLRMTTTEGRGGEVYASPPFGGPRAAPTPAELQVAPGGAILALRQFPDKAAEFDRWYGKGSADQILKNYPPAHRPPPLASVPALPGAELTNPSDQVITQQQAEAASAAAGREAASKQLGVRMGGKSYRVGRTPAGQVSTLTEETP